MSPALPSSLRASVPDRQLPLFQQRAVLEALRTGIFSQTVRNELGSWSEEELFGDDKFRQFKDALPESSAVPWGDVSQLSHVLVSSSELGKHVRAWHAGKGVSFVYLPAPESSSPL